MDPVAGSLASFGTMTVGFLARQLDTLSVWAAVLLVVMRIAQASGPAASWAARWS